MKLMRNPGLFLAVLALVGVFASKADAQPPTITFSQVGNALTVNWTAVQGATVYEVFVAGVPNSPFTTPSTSVVVNPAPPGTYVIQVRGRNGNQVGDLSAPTTIVVGGTGTVPGCGAIGAPTVAVSTAGMTVNVTWTPVAGAIGYRLQVGAAPGATQFQRDFGAGETGFGSAVPFIGTFYVRVIAANACGATATSTEQTFTLGAATPGPAPAPGPGGGGTGPRTPNPTATNGGVLCVPGRADLGYCIPVQSLGYATGIVNSVAAANGFDVRNSCHAEGGNMLFIYKAVRALRLVDSRWGLNMKRGNQGLSEDILAFNPTDRPDNGESQIYLFDVIGGHCGPNPIVSGLGDVTATTWNAGLANTPGCSTRFCAGWTLEGYLQSGFTP
jgi:hypothetical protein